MPKGQDDSDRDLIIAARSGDVEAFGKLYDRYAARVYRFLSAHLHNPQDAEDLTGEVFLRAWRSLDGYEERGLSFHAFLFRISRNCLIDHNRRAKNLPLQVPLDDEEGEKSLGDLTEHLHDSLERKQILRFLKLLSPDYQNVLLLRFVANYTIEETAEAMHKSIGAVRVLQHRAIKALKKLIES